MSLPRSPALAVAFLALAVALPCLGLGPGIALEAEAQPLPPQKIAALVAGPTSNTVCASLLPASPARTKCWGSNGANALNINPWFAGTSWGTGAVADQKMGSALPFAQFSAGIRQGCTGDDFGVAILTNGQVVAWGYNEVGQLAQGEDEEVFLSAPVQVNVGGPATSVLCGYAHACAVLASGSAACWGNNEDYQLGTSFALYGGSPTNVGDRPGSLLPNRLVPPVTVGLTGIRSASLGKDFSCFLTGAGVLKCVGANSYGQLGMNDSLATISSVGDYTTLGAALPSVTVHPGVAVRQVATGKYHTCALLANNGVKCWGYYSNGRLGLGSETDSNKGDEPGEMGAALPYVDMGSGFVTRTIVLGGHHSCAVSTTNVVKCWGLNDSGQVGVGLDSNVWGPPSAVDPTTFGVAVKQLVLTRRNTCAVLTNGGIKCYGDGSDGIPGQLSFNDWGISPTEIGTSLPYIVL